MNAYRKALAGQPSPQYALELGELYESLGSTRAARAQYDRLRARVGKEAAGGVDGALVLGRFEADHGDPAAAVTRLRAEWRRQPGIAVADALGWALHRAGDDKEALRFAVIATDRVHGGTVYSAPYMYHRGMIEQALDMTGPARRHLQEALRINPYFSPLFGPVARAAAARLGDEPPPPSCPSRARPDGGRRGPTGPTGAASRSLRELPLTGRRSPLAAHRVPLRGCRAGPAPARSPRTGP